MDLLMDELGGSPISTKPVIPFNRPDDRKPSINCLLGSDLTDGETTDCEKTETGDVGK